MEKEIECKMRYYVFPGSDYITRSSNNNNNSKV